MKKLLYHLLVWAISVITILLFGGCRVKKEEKKVKDSTSVHSVERTELSNKSLIDTGHTFKSKTVNQNAVLISRDSGKTKVTIMPVPGTTLIVDPDGTFRGQAASITTEHNGIKYTNKTIHTKKQRRQDNQLGKTQTENAQSQTKQKDSVTTHQLDQHLNIKSSTGLWSWAWLTAVAVMSGILLFGLRKTF